MTTITPSKVALITGAGSGIGRAVALGLPNTNVTSVFLCARAAYGLMRRQSPQGGRIINNGSISAHTPRPFTAPYTISKYAVTGLTMALALDGRAFNIVVSSMPFVGCG